MNLPYVFGISDNVRVPEGGLKSKAMIQAAFTVIFRCEEFRGKQQGAKRGGGEVSMLGSHSIRKYAATVYVRAKMWSEELVDELSVRNSPEFKRKPRLDIRARQLQVQILYSPASN